MYLTTLLSRGAGVSVPTLSLILFFNAPATTDIYTLSLHDALPISPHLYRRGSHAVGLRSRHLKDAEVRSGRPLPLFMRSEEHTSELQSHSDLVCRLLLEKKKKQTTRRTTR